MPQKDSQCLLWRSNHKVATISTIFRKKETGKGSRTRQKCICISVISNLPLGIDKSYGCHIPTTAGCTMDASGPLIAYLLCPPRLMVPLMASPLDMMQGVLIIVLCTFRRFSLRELSSGMQASVTWSQYDRSRSWRDEMEESARAAKSVSLLSISESVVSAVSLESCWMSVSVIGPWWHHSPRVRRVVSALR